MYRMCIKCVYHAYTMRILCIYYVCLYLGWHHQVPWVVQLRHHHLRESLATCPQGNRARWTLQYNSKQYWGRLLIRWGKPEVPSLDKLKPLGLHYEKKIKKRQNGDSNNRSSSNSISISSNKSNITNVSTSKAILFLNAKKAFGTHKKALP